MERRTEVTITLTEQSRALIAESVGAFWFFSVGAGAVVADAASGGRIGLTGIALANGLTLAAAVASLGAISGAHFNPAVTLGLWVAGRHPRDRVLTYWAAQAVGAIAAGLFLRIVFDHAPAAAYATNLGTPTVAAGLGPLAAILVELVLTAFLLWAVFGTAVSPSVVGPRVGLMVAGAILVGGPLTGAAMNPARWLGPAVASGFLDNWFVYWIGPLAGAAIAGLFYRYVFAPPEERAEIVVPAISSPPDSTERM